MDASPAACLARALRSLDGLSVGDAFGASFFRRPEDVAVRRLSPESQWLWTDDTAMAISVIEELVARGDVDEDELARRFARRFSDEPWRGYGRTAKVILSATAGGTPWLQAAQAPFDGTGSKGNGGAMRVPPLGAYFAHDLPRLIAAARRSARPTHLHPEGEAGTIAVAVAAATAARMAAGELPRDAAALFAATIEHTPPGSVRDGIVAAAALPTGVSLNVAASRLGNGTRELADDTVALCMWITAGNLDDFEAALWACVTAGGDIDTTGAIVGGILGAAGATIPHDWLTHREALPALQRPDLSP